MVERTLSYALSKSPQISGEQMNWITDMFSWRVREMPYNESRTLEELLINMVDSLTQLRDFEEASALDYDDGYDDGYRVAHEHARLGIVPKN